MSALADFLHPLFEDGTVSYREPPAWAPKPDAEAAVVLGRAFRRYRLDVAGPLLDFDLATAHAAAELVRQAGWFLFSRDEPVAELDRRLTMPAPPQTAVQHLSADLTLRYLPRLHRQAQAVAPADRLVACLADVLRQWPLSGVLSAVAEAPTTVPEFDGHLGLRLLYAERLAENEKPAWVPEGPARAYAELAFAERGKRLQAPIANNKESEDARD